MRRMLFLLAATAAAVAAAAVPAGASSSTSITIRHQVRGCHAWAIAGGAYKASQRLTVSTGTSLRFTNNDVMPHTLVQLAGPRVVFHAPRMGHMSARTTIVLRRPGTYRFATKAGEDYPMMGGMKTIGEDNVLELVVVVR